MAISEQLIDNVVSSWTFAAAQQILDETATPSLPISKFYKDGASGSSGKMRTFGSHPQELKVNVAEPKTMMHPVRSSSLSHRRTSVADAPYSMTTGQVVYDHGRFEERPTPQQQPSAVQGAKSGLQELAGNRAHLYIVQRRILERLGKALGWQIGWAAVVSSQVARTEDMDDVDLNESDVVPSQDANGDSKVKAGTNPTIGICIAALVDAGTSIEQFRTFYEVRPSRYHDCLLANPNIRYSAILRLSTTWQLAKPKLVRVY